MADYSKEEIKRIEEKWREEWQKRHVYRVENQSDKPKYYVLDMFPYPSGAGLHVGHPLGYIASDIVARFKRLRDLMYCIRWALMHSDCLQSNMLSIMEFIPQFLRQRTFTTSKISCRKLVSAMTGVAKFKHAIRNITNGHNGSSSRSSIAGSTEKKEKQNALMN